MNPQALLDGLTSGSPAMPSLASPEDVDLPVVSVVVLTTTADVATCRVERADGTTVEALLPVSEFYPDKQFSPGHHYIGQLVESAGRPMLSVIRPSLVTALLAGFAPEVRSGAVRVMGCIRLAGVRSKIAVAATEEGLDPIAACVGREANRVRALTTALQGERIDIVAWHPSPDVYLRNALAPAEVDRVDINGRDAVAYAPPHQMAAAVGHGGLNSSLAGRLVGVKVRVEQA